MKNSNQIKLMMGALSLLLIAAVVSCTRNLSVPVAALVITSTPTMTKSPTPLGSTATMTNTQTPVNTQTSTSTETVTNTFTPLGNTYTATSTQTVTNTETVTNTSTPQPPTSTSTSTNTAGNTSTSTSTPTMTNTVAAAATNTPTQGTGSGAGGSFIWDDFDEAPWTQPPPSYLYGVYYENAATHTIAYNTTAARNSSVGAFEDDITFTAAAGEEDLSILQGLPPNYGGNADVYDFIGANPSAMSCWIYTNNSVLIDKAYVYNGSLYNLTAAPPVMTIPANTWTNVVVPITAGNVPVNMTAVNYVEYIILPPTGTGSYPYVCNVVIDDIYFYQ